MPRIGKPADWHIEVASIAALYTAIAIWWLWPLPMRLGTHSAYFSADFPLVAADHYLVIWGMAWDAHALLTAPLHLFHANAFHPATDALAYSEHLLGYAVLFAPTYWITGNPILAANLVILSTYPLCGVAMYLLARRFTTPPAAALAGFFFAFYPGRIDVLPHIHLLGVFWMPLAMLATERWLDEARRRDAIFLAVALTFQALSSFYLAFALLVAYVPYLALALWRWRGRLDRRRLLGLAAAFASTAAVMGVTGIPYLRLQRLGLIPSYDGAGETAPLGLLASLGGLRVWDFLVRLSVGPVGWALALIALSPPWRRTNGARRTAVAIAVIGTIAAFGVGIPLGAYTLWTPYALVARWIPGAATIRQPSRFVVVVQLGLALLAGLGFGRLFGRVASRRAFAAAATAAGLTLLTFRPLPRPPLVPEPIGTTLSPAYRWLAEHGDGRPLLEEPAPNFGEAARRMYLSTFHWLPIIDGYSGYPPASAAYVHKVAYELPDDAAVQTLVDTVDVQWILVHRGQMGPARIARWDGPLADGVERVAEWNDDLLLRVTRAPSDDRRGRLLGTTETLGGVPLAPVGDRCPGRIVVRSLPSSPWTPLAKGHVEVDIQNDGPAAWPAFGFVPRHLVRLEACLSPIGAPPCTDKPMPLSSDVPPGGDVPVALDLTAPRAAGSYTVDLRLVQVGDEPLANCGVKPIRLPIEVESRDVRSVNRDR